jgi:hypothetical protein
MTAEEQEQARADLLAMKARKEAAAQTRQAADASDFDVVILNTTLTSCEFAGKRYDIAPINRFAAPTDCLTNRRARCCGPGVGFRSYGDFPPCCSGKGRRKLTLGQLKV